MAVMRNSQEALLTIVEVRVVFPFFLIVTCHSIFSFLSLSLYALLYQILRQEVLVNLNVILLDRYFDSCNLKNQLVFCMGTISFRHKWFSPFSI